MQCPKCDSQKVIMDFALDKLRCMDCKLQWDEEAENEKKES